MIASLQPFGLASGGGGPRILRALFEDAPVEVLSVCISSDPPPPTTVAHEIHVRPRAPLGRLDRTRLGAYADLAALSRRGGALVRRLVQLLEPADGVHIVMHDGTLGPAVEAARRLNLPFFLSAHDDVEYADPLWARRANGRRVLAVAWQEAAARFAISPQLGDEYCRRLGVAPYSIVTDGVSAVRAAPRPARGGGAIYFMGLLHLSYEPNFLALFDALDTLALAADPAVSLTARCDLWPTPGLRKRAAKSLHAISILPIASEAAVESDLEGVDMLYLPLPFDTKHEALVRLSLSTKLITYLGSGLPIVYHGPAYGTAYELLSESDAALLVTTLDTDALAAAFRSSLAERRAVAANGLALARRAFLLEDQRRTFWNALGYGRNGNS